MSIKLNRPLLKVSAFVFTCMFMFNAQAGTVSSTLDQTTPGTTGPDIFSLITSAGYTGNSTDGDFIASGTAIDLTYLGSTETIDSGAFTLVADIQKDDGTADGVLTIGGKIAALGFNSGTLLTGRLAQIGGSNVALNFVFNITGGDAAVLYGNRQLGVIMGGTGYSGIASFNDVYSGAGVADAFKVPVTNTIALFLVGFAALGLRRKSRA